MRKRLLSILALTILVTSTLVGCSDNPSPSSTLTIFSITEGEVLVMKAGTDDWIPWAAEMPLAVGDSVKTGDDSGAEITFFDGSTIELEAGTLIKITSLYTSPGTDAKTITLMQTIGTTISRVTKLLDPASSYAVETPNGVAAVRGTTMIVTVEYVTPQIINTLVTIEEGQAVFTGHGGELQVPEGRRAFADDAIVELVPLNRPPVAVSDSAVTDADSSITVNAPGVLSNDSDPDGDTLVVTALNTIGTIGTVTAWGPDGSFTYDPDGQFEYLQAGNSTSDSFTYTVSDGNGGTDTATVTVIINGVYNPPVDYPPVYYPPVNYPPVAVGDSTTTSGGTSVTINILGNDSDPDGDILTVISVTQGHNGTVTNSGSDVTYTPDPGFTGTDSFTYTISDGHGGTSTATVTVTIANVNNPPAAVDDSATTPQNTAVTIDVLSNDSDPDGDTPTVYSATHGTHGSVVNNGSSVTYTPDSGFTGTDSFTYTISDGKGGTDTATVTVTVTAIQTPARIYVHVVTGPTASIFIWDATTGGWAIDVDTQEPVDGTNHVTSDSITVVAGHYYYVWVEAPNSIYHVAYCPCGWITTSAPAGDNEAVYGCADTGTVHPAHFSVSHD
jgi:VCBS repeat-containing protein